MHLIDTHAHIYLEQFASDRDAVIQKALDTGVKAILLPAIDSTTHTQMLQLEASTDCCVAMMGLHPCSVNASSIQAELQTVEQNLASRNFIAIGEIGLDFYWDRTFEKYQYEAFNRQLEWCEQYNLPAVIHSRNATPKCINVIRQHPNVTGVFHCFSGTADEADQIISLGWKLGIGGVVTFKNGGLDKVLPHIGLDQIVLETDAPYLAPMPFRGKRNEPGYLTLIAEKVARLMGTDIQNVANITTKNAETLFRLPYFQ